MPVPGIIKGNASLNTYQNFDGSNLTIAGFEEKAVTNKGSVGAFLGVGTNFNDNVNAVIDFKGTYKYDKKGLLNQNLRIRNTIGLTGSTTQIRYSPLSVNIPISDKVSLYANPHYAGKFNYKTNEWSNSAGIFAGTTVKIAPKTSLSMEIQRYNLQNLNDNSGKNWGVNAILTCDL